MLRHSRMFLVPALALASAGVLAQAQPAPAVPANPWAMPFGTFSLDSRMRFENVDDAGFAETATALTWRSRLGFRSKAWRGFSAYVEVEDVRALIDDYSVSSAAGNTRPVISDPKGAEWNQANLVWDSGSGLKTTVGRQRLVFDNQRFFGNVGWRQNEQTFDAAAVNWVLPNKGVLDVVWLDAVHRIFGHSNPNPALREWDLNAPLLHYTQPTKYGSFSAYAYLVENEDLVAQSARTFGARFTGKMPTGTTWQPIGTAEFARQSDWAEAVSRGDQGYALLELGLAGPRGHVVKAGWELLGGDGQFAFQTPFATLHAFNGWADRFLTTPLNGLDDRYVSWAGPCGTVQCSMAWHTYESDRFGIHLGREFNASAGYAFTPRLSALVKYARFGDAEALADVDKFWIGIDYKR